MSLWNWHVEFELKEDHQKIIGKLTDELWKEYDLPADEREHFLFEARSETKYPRWGWQGKASDPQVEKDLHSEFVDAVYSNCFTTFLVCFFGNLNVYAHNSITMEDYCGEECYEAVDQLQEFLALVCKPKETFIESQYVEDDCLPFRHVLCEDGSWDTVSPTLKWPE